MNVYLSAT